MSGKLKFLLNRLTGFLVAFFLIAYPAALSAASSLPDWLSSALEAKETHDDADAVILDHYHRETIGSRARLDLHTRFAIRINDRNAREWAKANIPIEGNKRNLKLFKAWLILPGGRVETYKKKDLIFVADRLDDLYSESKRCVFDRSASIRPGTVFAFEYKIQRDLHFLSTHWSFQSIFPTIRSRFELDIPDGWTARPFFFNGDPIPVQNAGNIQYWEVRDTPGIKEEPNQPPFGQMLFQMAVNLEAPAREKKKYNLEGFSSWADVARYTVKVHRKSLMDLAPSISAKSHELTGDKITTWEKIQAIANYAQSINYVSTSMDLHKGGGHKPRHPNDVFSQHWGDCKDMAALTRALLAEAGVESVPVLARIGEDDHVPEKWPSPFLFNHCIVGIPINEFPQSASVLEDTQLGPIILFDPTQRYTPFGNLPESLMGTRILLGSQEIEKLVEVPPPDPGTRHVDRKLEATILPNGDLQARLTEAASGSAADYLRSVALTSSEKELKEFIHGWISSSTRLAEVQHIESIDGWDRGEFTLVIDFTATRFAKSVGSDHYAFPPVFLTQLAWVPPIREDRSTDYITEAWSLDESIHYTLADELTIENLPETAQVQDVYGNYAISASRTDDGFSISREYEVFHQSIDPDQYPEIVDHFEKISRIDTAQVVLNYVDQLKED